jgi:hypothetical protein
MRNQIWTLLHIALLQLDLGLDVLVGLLYLMQTSMRSRACLAVKVQTQGEIVDVIRRRAKPPWPYERKGA